MEQSLQNEAKVRYLQEMCRRAYAREELTSFCKWTHPNYQPSWHHRLIAEWLERVTRDELPEGVDGVMVFAPPRHGKSEMVDIRWPAWHLGHKPHEHFIATAYGDELARTFSKACRNTIAAPSYQQLWQHELKESADTKWQLRRKADDERATFIAAGILGTLTGEGADKLLVDDPVKNAEDAYSKKMRDKVDDNYKSAASTRLMPNGKTVVVMTRWHEDDLAGRLIRRALDDRKSTQWIVVVLPATNDDGEGAYVWNTRTGEKRPLPAYEALWPEAYPRHVLDRVKADKGEVFWNAMYQQRPQAATGGIFKRGNWAWHDNVPKFNLLVQAWDTAHAEGQDNDYSASVTMGAGPGSFPVLDAWRGKVGFPVLVERVYLRWDEAAARYGRWPNRVLVENKGSGISLIQQLQTNNLAGFWTFPNGETKKVPFIPVTPMQATVSKLIRAQGISGYHESRAISLPRGADWVDDFVDELALFDKGPHDDWVDVLVHAMTWFVRPVKDDEYETPVVLGQDHQIDAALDEAELFSSW